MPSIHRLLPAVAAAAMLCGCVGPAAYGVLSAARSDLSGLTKADVAMCAGFPSEIRQIGGGEIWSYVHKINRAGLNLSLPGVGGLYSGVNTSFSVPNSAECRAQIRFVDGKVVEVAYAGDNDTAQGRDLVCLPIVDDCVAYTHEKRGRGGGAAAPPATSAPANSPSPAAATPPEGSKPGSGAR